MIIRMAITLEQAVSEATDDDWWRFDQKWGFADGEHWLWSNALNGDGYGSFYLGGQMRGAHRVAWMRFIGTLRPGIELDHLCRVRSCVSVAHLQPVTHALNVLRGESPHAINARKQVCVRGHEFDLANTLLSENGRRCRTCVRAHQREAGNQKRRLAREAAGLVKKSEQTHCSHGHAFTGENTYVKPNGTRDCKACRRRRAQESAARKTAQPV